MAAKKNVSEPSAPKRNLSVGRAPDFGLYYSDAVRMAMGPYDLKLTFSVTETLPNNDVVITEMLTIAMSPQHAKVFSEALVKNVERYETDVMPVELSQKYKDENRLQRQLTDFNIVQSGD